MNNDDPKGFESEPRPPSQEIAPPNPLEAKSAPTGPGTEEIRIIQTITNQDALTDLQNIARSTTTQVDTADITAPNLPTEPKNIEQPDITTQNIEAENAKKEFDALYRTANNAITSYKNNFGEKPSQTTQEHIRSYERDVGLRVAQAIIETNRTKAELLANQDPYIKEVLDLEQNLQSMQDNPTYKNEGGQNTPDPNQDPNLLAIQKKIDMHPRRLERNILRGLYTDYDNKGQTVREFLTEIYKISKDPRKQFTDFTRVTSHYDPVYFEFHSTLQADIDQNVQDINGTRLYEDFVASCPKSAEAYNDFPPIRYALEIIAGRNELEKQTKASTPEKADELESDKDKQTALSELKPVLSEEEIRQKLKEQIPDPLKGMTKEQLEERRMELATKPQLGNLNRIIAGADLEPTFAWTQVDKIVGRTFEDIDGWATENESRKGRIAQVASEIIDSDNNPENLEHIFHPAKPNERIKLTALVGPAGPIYQVNDGQHRVSGAMLSGISEIPADVETINYPFEQIVSAGETERLEDLEKKIQLGLIDGEIQDYISKAGNKMKKLVVHKEVLPWIRSASQADLIKISKTYEQLYPGSLDNLPIPKQALLDPVANNFYMAGRWDEWAKSRSSFDEQPQANINPKGENETQATNALDKYIVTRNGQIMEVTGEELTPEEREDFTQQAPPIFEGNPLDDPSGYLDFLKQKNPDFSYDVNTTPDMIKKALVWAQDENYDPSDLEPIHILIAQEHIPGTNPMRDSDREILEDIEIRASKLRANKDQLTSILVPSNRAYFHSTPVAEYVQGILDKGLYCDIKLGLAGSAISLDEVPPNADENMRKNVEESNIEKLSKPKGGYRYGVIIELPELTPKQETDYQERLASGESVDYASLFVQALPEKIGGQGAAIEYDAILPPQYIKGVIDLDTGQYIAKEEFTAKE